MHKKLRAGQKPSAFFIFINRRASEPTRFFLFPKGIWYDPAGEKIRMKRESSDTPVNTVFSQGKIV